jgi:hypothetical protein
LKTVGTSNTARHQLNALLLRRGRCQDELHFRKVASFGKFLVAFQSCKSSDYSGVMESADIKGLHKTCVERLKGLIAQANRTCSLLESITELPITLDTWLKVVEQRVTEDDAHLRYQEVRERLFDAIRPPQQGSTVSDVNRP